MSVLEFIKVVILGIVEGITEWLPISSTGHMILVDEFIKMDMTTEFKDFFLVVIQLGAIQMCIRDRSSVLQTERKHSLRKESFRRAHEMCIRAA